MVGCPAVGMAGLVSQAKKQTGYMPSEVSGISFSAIKEVIEVDTYRKKSMANPRLPMTKGKGSLEDVTIKAENPYYSFKG